MGEINILELIRRAAARAEANDEYNFRHPQPIVMHPLDYERAVREGLVKPWMQPTMINVETNDE